MVRGQKTCLLPKISTVTDLRASMDLWLLSRNVFLKKDTASLGSGQRHCFD